jgi:hypothetical protein
MAVHENLPIIFIIPVIWLLWIWYKEKKKLVDDLKIFLNNTSK